MTNTPEKLKYYVDGQWRESKTEKYMECFNASTGEVVALAPQCTQEEVNSAIQAASDAFPEWASTPVTVRIQVLFRLKALIDKHFDELVHLVCEEQGKCWAEAVGCIAKTNEVVEFACGMTQSDERHFYYEYHPEVTTPCSIWNRWVCLPGLHPGIFQP